MTIRWLIGFGLLAAPLRASEVAGSSALLNAPFSVRQLGMGGVSVAGSDVLQAWSNPAMLSDPPSRGSLSLNGGSLFDQTQSDAGAGIGLRLDERWAMGIVAATSVMSFVEISADGQPSGRSIGRIEGTGGLVGAFRRG